MRNESKILCDIQKRKKYLQKRLAVTNDAKEIRAISCSLQNYLEMEYHLSNLSIFLEKMSLSLFKQSIMLNRSVPYLSKIDVNSNYLDKKLDVDYVHQLLSNLATPYFFDIPSTLTYNDNELIKLTRDFYNETFTGKIRDYSLEIIGSHNIHIMNRAVLFTNIYGKNYADPYFGDTYCYVFRSNTDVDFLTLAHEVYHSVCFKLNKDSVYSFVNESKEIGTTTIELLFTDYLIKQGGTLADIGNYLKKVIITSLSNRSHLLNANFGNINQSISFTSDFLLLEAMVVGYGLYLEYLEDPVKTSNKMIEIAQYNFNNDNLPDYSSFGYSKEEILLLSKNFKSKQKTI